MAAPQPTAPTPQPPPNLPPLPGAAPQLANYLQTFALWCRGMFQGKLDRNVALPGILLTDGGVPPAVYQLGVTTAGVATLAPVPLAGDPGAPVPIGAGAYLPVNGVIDGSDAAAGQVGEYRSAQRTSASAIALTSNTAANLTSISLTAGDWDVEGTVSLACAASLITNAQGWVSSTSAASPGARGTGGQFVMAGGSGIVNNYTQSTGQLRFSLTATTTIYLGGYASFATGPCTASGFIRARRAR